MADVTRPGQGHALLRRAHLATPARTLLDIFAETVQRYPDSAAVDNGLEVLTYRELLEAAV